MTSEKQSVKEELKQSQNSSRPNLLAGASITFLDLYYLLNEMIVMDKDALEELLRSQPIPDEVISRTMEAISKLEDC